MVEKKLDEFASLAKERLRSSIEERNSLISTLKASQGDRASLIESLRNQPLDGPLGKIQAAREKAYADFERLTNELNAQLEPMADEMLASGKANVEELTTKIGELDKMIVAGIKYFSDLYGSDVVADLPERTSLRGTRKSGETARRVRGFNFWVDGVLATSKDNKGQEVSNLAAAAKLCNVEAKDMREAFWQAQGTQDSAQYKDTVQFTLTNGDNAYTVLAERNTTDKGAEAATATTAQ